MEPAQSAQRLETLDILRGLMALAVAVYHLSIWTQLFTAGSRNNNVLACLGNYGVEGFFILSGFCFFHIYANASWNLNTLGQFHIKRLLRIAPLYFLVVLLNLALRQHVGPAVTLRMLVENFTLSFGLFHPNHALVLGGWSIGIEYVFYFAFPILAWICRKKHLFYLLCILLILWSLPWNFGKVQAASLIGNEKFHTYVQIPNHAFLFLLGGLAAHWRSLTPRRLPWPAFLALLILLGGYGLRQIPHFYDHFDILAGNIRFHLLSLCFLAVLIFAFFDLPRQPWLRPLTFLGDWSYAIYLIHPLAYYGISQCLPPDIGPWPHIVLGLGSTLLLAALVHRYLERPAIALGRRWAARLASRPI